MHDCVSISDTKWVKLASNTADLTRFNKIATQARAQAAADNDAVGLSRVHMYESKCILR